MMPVLQDRTRTAQVVVRDKEHLRWDRRAVEDAYLT